MSTTSTPGADTAGRFYTAVALLEAQHEPDRAARIAALLPGDPIARAEVIGAAIWMADMMAISLAQEMGTDRATVVAALREDITDMFTKREK